MDVRIVIDVEMCSVQNYYRDYPCKNEIIQIGAVMLDDSYKIIDKFSSYVHPRYGRISYFISNLTGITERDTKKAPELAEVLDSLLVWIGDRNATFYAWSDTDYSQIWKEVRKKHLNKSRLTTIIDKTKWCDYQQVVSNRFKISRQLRLSEALDLAEVDVEGRLHDGLVDSSNTARLIAKLELEPDFQPVTERLRLIKDLNQEPLSTSLGSLLAGIMMTA